MDKPRDDLKTRLDEARIALEGEEWRKKRAAKEESLTKRRREAVLAMEGETHRKKRETRERLSRELAEKGHDEEEAAAQKLAAEQTRAAAEAEAKQRQKNETETAFKGRVAKIEESEQLISELAKEASTGLSPVRTLKTDMAQAVKEEGISVARIAMTEQARRAGQPPTGTVRPARKIAALVVFVIILAAAAGGAFLYITQPQLIKDWLAFLLPPQGKKPPPAVPLSQPLIFSEKFEAVIAGPEINRGTLLAKISEAATAQLPPKTIKYIYFTDGKRLLPFNYLRQILALNLPGDLNRALKDDFMFGVYNSQNSEPRRFLILTNNFFERAFSGLLQWEKTMVSDLAPLLLTAVPSIAPGQLFGDKVVRNKDSRLITDSEGKTILFYGFLDNARVVITTAEDAFIEVLQRFVAS